MYDPFVERKEKKENGFTVETIFKNLKPVVGELGLEIEVEGTHLLYDDTPLPWLYKQDGSLRGDESGEYVLKKPIFFKDLPEALSKLWAAFEKKGTKFNDSNRTSVHVHLNCQNFHFNRLTALMALYFTVEEPLTRWCGEHREGNLFCLRSRDATAIISQLRKFIKSDGKYQLHDHLHYSGLNAHSLQTFGSLEVRTMRGVSDPTVIQDWVDILQRLYDYSEEFPDPRDVCGSFSRYGPLSMFNTILGNKASVVRLGIDYTDEQLRESMFKGIRLAQDLCYCREWDIYKPITLKPDPFNRALRDVVPSLMATSETYEEEIASPTLLNTLTNNVSWGLANNPQH